MKINTEQTKNKKYIDMNQKELQECITREQDFINSYFKISEYDIKNKEELNRQIKVNQEIIKEIKAKYEREIKINKELIKKAKQELKEKGEREKEKEEFKQDRLFNLKLIKEIKEQLNKNPNYYK